MTIKDIQRTHEVESALAKLEHKNKSWKSDFLKQISIMDEILMGINSTDKTQSEFWIDVQTLYCNKSKTQ